MNKEIYVWLVVILAVAFAGLYLRYFYQAQIGIALSLNTTGLNTSLYPYQRFSLPIVVNNTGSGAIENLSLGVFINGNLTVPYKVTLPQGKQAIIRYNYTPSIPGNYDIMVSADPGKLYNIADRSKTSASVTLRVGAPETAAAYGLVPAANLTSLHNTNFGKGGYIVQAYLSNNYKVSDFALIDSAQISRLLTPLLNSTFNDIYNMSVSTARYGNGDSAYSIWIRGYLNPDVVLALFSNASSVLSQKVSLQPFGNITYLTLPNYTTLCGWYSGGWLKLFGYVGSRTCYQILSSGTLNGTAQSFGKLPLLENVSALANYTGEDGNTKYAATLSLTPTSFIYARISNSTGATNASDVCYGIADSANGMSYCSTYISPISGHIGNLSLVRTTAYIAGYNASVFSLSNSSKLLYQVPININVIRRFGISGNYLQFQSALSSTCSLNASFPCSNTTFENGTIKVTVENNLGSDVRLGSLGCYAHGAFAATSLGNATVAAGKSANLTATCFSNGAKLSGILVNLNLNLLLNYTVANRTQTLPGKAQIPFG